MTHARIELATFAFLAMYKHNALPIELMGLKVKNLTKHVKKCPNR
jgi:hypothetical protein